MGIQANTSGLNKAKYDKKKVKKNKSPDLSKMFGIKINNKKTYWYKNKDIRDIKFDQFIQDFPETEKIR